MHCTMQMQIAKILRHLRGIKFPPVRTIAHRQNTKQQEKQTRAWIKDPDPGHRTPNRNPSQAGRGEPEERRRRASKTATVELVNAEFQLQKQKSPHGVTDPSLKLYAVQNSAGCVPLCKHTRTILNDMVVDPTTREANCTRLASPRSPQSAHPHLCTRPIAHRWDRNRRDDRTQRLYPQARDPRDYGNAARAPLSAANPQIANFRCPNPSSPIKTKMRRKIETPPARARLCGKCVLNKSCGESVGRHECERNESVRSNRSEGRDTNLADSKLGVDALYLTKIPRPLPCTESEMDATPDAGEDSTMVLTRGTMCCTSSDESDASDVVLEEERTGEERLEVKALLLRAGVRYPSSLAGKTSLVNAEWTPHKCISRMAKEGMGERKGRTEAHVPGTNLRLPSFSPELNIELMKSLSIPSATSKNADTEFMEVEWSRNRRRRASISAIPVRWPSSGALLVGSTCWESQGESYGLDSASLYQEKRREEATNKNSFSCSAECCRWDSNPLFALRRKATLRTTVNLSSDLLMIELQKDEQYLGNVEGGLFGTRFRRPCAGADYNALDLGFQWIREVARSPLRSTPWDHWSKSKKKPHPKTLCGQKPHVAFAQSPLLTILLFRHDLVGVSLDGALNESGGDPTISRIVWTIVAGELKKMKNKNEKET
ncbi:hypothetical protein K438DRAFT_1935087 [Mycena galopus ATCC 62051]|nr:hypothetical protein K438DRAFT_1935087 [Mycena galopus ATCC 62051]